MPRSPLQRVVQSCAVALASAVVALPAHGDTVSSQSTIALSADYNSNPFLQTSNAHAAESGAILATVPLTYSTDQQTANLSPSVRLAKTQGDDELLTNYQYLNGDWRFADERNTLTVAAGLHHDSTFYNVIENAELRGTTLPRLEDTANAGWQRALTERSSVQIGASWDEVKFASRPNATLTNFNYVQGSLGYSFALAERLNWTLSLGDGRYDASEQHSSNENRFAQSSLSYSLSELWTGVAQVGVSHATSSGVAVLCCFLVQTPEGIQVATLSVTQETSANSVNYLVSAQHQNENSVVSLSVSRALQPSGLGALLTEQDVIFGASFPLSERLTMGTTLHGARVSDTLAIAGNSVSSSYLDAEITATWSWTEHWSLGVQGGYIVQRTSGQHQDGSGAKVALTLTRSLGRITFQ